MVTFWTEKEKSGEEMGGKRWEGRMKRNQATTPPSQTECEPKSEARAMTDPEWAVKGSGGEAVPDALQQARAKFA